MTARRVLLANASFTAASAVIILAARERLHPLFALESSALLAVVAGGLLVYAGFLVAAARREPPDRATLLTAGVLDAAWVLGTVVLLIIVWGHLAPAGRMLLLAAGVIVEVFATLQYRAARSLATAPVGGDAGLQPGGTG